MIIKKWKAGRADKVGVLQVKLSNQPNGCVMLSVVNEAGERISGGNILTLSKDGVDMMLGVKDFGIEKASGSRVVVR